MLREEAFMSRSGFGFLMSSLFALLACSCQSSAPSAQPPYVTPAGGAFASGAYADLFSALLGKSESEVETKVNTALARFFDMGNAEPATPVRDSGYRCYYELPQDRSMAFIWSADSNDIRTEGMSYGMMIAVQAGMRTQFDKLWKFARTNMQYRSDQTVRALNTSADSALSPWNHYFAWTLEKVNVKNPGLWSWTLSPGTCPASDGEEYFAAALYLADRRWGSVGSVNYKAEADSLSAAMLHNSSSGEHRALFNRNTGVARAPIQVTFCPIGAAADYTDPSYHLPALYELFALCGPEADRATWQGVANGSRAFLVSAASRATGLHPDYATFGGRPTTMRSGSGATATKGRSGNDHDTFRYDAWRVVMNMALDYYWWKSDEAMKTLVEAYHQFFSAYKSSDNVSASLFSLDGKNAGGGGSTALTATLATGSLVSQNADAAFWVKALWNVNQQSGTYRYYQECVYLLGLLNVSGRFRLSF
jgi:oligosaccharide reducing-end xylanase